MNPLKIIESGELLLAGCLIKNEGGNEWAEWEEKDAKGTDDVRYAHHNLVDGALAHEVRFYPESGEYVFTGLEVTRGTGETLWEYIKVPAAPYAVFEIDYKIEAQPQYESIDKWLDDNKDTYKQLEWDADGRVASSIFVLCLYDHEGKFGKERIMEMRIPLVRIKNELIR